MQTTRLTQLWVADISYIRLRQEHVYAAVVLDAHSRRAIGWSLESHLEAKLAIRALQMPIERRIPKPWIIHHSDRGIQFACAHYAVVLAAADIQGSMSTIRNPYDNAQSESFMKTLKQEKGNGTSYKPLNHLRERSGDFFEVPYNQKRLHSSLGYLSPNQFESEAGS